MTRSTKLGALLSDKQSREHQAPSENPRGKFLPFSCLFEGEMPRFASEQSARWFLRQQRAALVEAGAIGIFTGKICINLERFDRVYEQIAIRAADRHLARSDDDRFDSHVPASSLTAPPGEIELRRRASLSIAGGADAPGR